MAFLASDLTGDSVDGGGDKMRGLQGWQNRLYEGPELRLPLDERNPAEGGR